MTYPVFNGLPVTRHEATHPSQQFPGVPVPTRAVVVVNPVQSQPVRGPQPLPQSRVVTGGYGGAPNPNIRPPVPQPSIGVPVQPHRVVNQPTSGSPIIFQLADKRN